MYCSYKHGVTGQSSVLYVRIIYTDKTKKNFVLKDSSQIFLLYRNLFTFLVSILSYFLRSVTARRGLLAFLTLSPFSYPPVPLLLVKKNIKDDIIFLVYLSFFSTVPALLKPPGEDNKGSTAPRPHSVYRKKPTVQRSHTQREDPAASAEARKKRVPHAEKEVREYKEINYCKQSESKSVQERQRVSERSISYVVFILPSLAGGRHCCNRLWSVQYRVQCTLSGTHQNIHCHHKHNLQRFQCPSADYSQPHSDKW
jgi:hypothetical protein